MHTTDALEVYTVSFFRYKNEYLLLQRSQDKVFAPGLWTGLGGHVEAHEYRQLRAAALREVAEEAGLPPQDITDFVLRRTLLVSRPRQPFGLVLYYTGVLSQQVTPECPEGTLFWKPEAAFESLDIIPTTRPVLSLLIKDMDQDPQGAELPKIGMAVFDPQGMFQHLIWSG